MTQGIQFGIPWSSAHLWFPHRYTRLEFLVKEMRIFAHLFYRADSLGKSPPCVLTIEVGKSWFQTAPPQWTDQVGNRIQLFILHWLNQLTLLSFSASPMFYSFYLLKNANSILNIHSQSTVSLFCEMRICLAQVLKMLGYK